MRTFGTLTLERDGLDAKWRVAAEPHVLIKIKSICRRTDSRSLGAVAVEHSDEVCRDLQWFTERYPLDVSDGDRFVLDGGAASYVASLERLETINLPNHVPMAFPLALPPRHYQSVAAEGLLLRKSQLLADHVGLGKSVTALAAVTEVMRRTKQPALVICQAHLPKQWKAYIGKFLPLASCHIIKTGKLYDLPPADIYVCTYHKLAKWKQILAKVCHGSMICFDEIQELRHPDSAKYSAAMQIREACGYAHGLSATPIFNYGGEIFNVLEVLSPGEVGTREEFEREWCSGFGKHCTLKAPDAFGSYLRERGLMVRRTRADVGLELPPIQTIIETVEHDDKVLRDLDTVATELAHRLLAKETSFHDKGEAAREFDMKMRQATGIAKAPFCAAFVNMLVESGEKVVLTGWHRCVYDVWLEMLKQHRVVLYTGTESPAAKSRSVAQFCDTSNGGANVFIMSLRSGSGLDGLQNVCSTIVHGELDWSPGVMLQCTGRLARDGQTKSVFEYYMISDGGSDPVVADVLGIKRAQSDGLLGQGSILLGTQTDDTSRVKRLAEDYLARRHHKRLDAAAATV